MYSSTVAHQYSVLSATGDFLNGTLIPPSNELNIYARRLQDEGMAGNLERLENAECVSAYAQTFQAVRGDVVLILDHAGTNGIASFESLDLANMPSIGIADEVPEPYPWMCGSAPSNGGYSLECTGRGLTDATHDPNNRRSGGKRIRYCLSAKPPQYCKLQLSLPLILMVIAFNLCKTVVMLVVAFDTKEEPLLTLGDAIASFIGRTDNSTKDLNLASKFTCSRWGTGWDPARTPLVYTPKTHCWYRAVSKVRWFGCDFK